MSAENDLRDAMIEVIEPITNLAGDQMGAADPEQIADAIIALLARWRTAGPGEVDRPPYHNRLEGNVVEGQ